MSQKTGVDCLAIAIGTAHGIYPKGYVPKLQLELLKEIKKVAPVPLVLHGGSNILMMKLLNLVESVFLKLIFQAILKSAYFAKVKEVLDTTGGFVPAKVLDPAIQEAKKVIAQKMELFSSIDKAKLYW